jgi:hypothetical protein
MNCRALPIRRPPVLIIARVVADEMGICADAVVAGSARRGKTSQARHVALFIAVETYGYSGAQTALQLNVCQQAVWQALKRVRSVISTDEDVAELVATCVERLKRWNGFAASVVPPASTEPDLIPGLPSWAREALRLRAKGWSVRGLAKRFSAPPDIVAKVVGAEFWAGPRVESEALA